MFTGFHRSVHAAEERYRRRGYECCLDARDYQEAAEERFIEEDEDSSCGFNFGLGLKQTFEGEKMREKIWKHEWLIYVDMVGNFNLFFNLFSLISVGWGSPMMFGALEQWWYQVLWVSEDPYWWRGDPQLLCFDLPSTSEEHLTHGAPTSSQWCLGHCSNHLDISMPCARWWLDQKRVAPISRYFMYIFAFFAYFPIYLSLYFICSFFLYFS